MEPKPIPNPIPNPAVNEPDEVVDVNVSQVTVQRRNWNGPEFVIEDGGYTGRSSVSGAKLVMEASPKTDAGTTRADRIAISHVKSWPGDLAGRPTVTDAANTLKVTWVRGGTEAHIDFGPYLMVRRFPIPKGTRAHIPVRIETAPKLGQVLRICFSEAQFEPITERKKKDGGTGAAAAGKQEPPQG